MTSPKPLLGKWGGGRGLRSICPQMTLETNNRCGFLQQDEKNANESQFRQTLLLLHKKHLSIRKEKNGQHFCLFKPFPHDIFREMVPGPLRLLFCYKSNSNNPICVPAALLFHPQQMCLQACVNHDGEVLAVLLGSCETAGRSSTAATRPLPTTSMRLL